MISIFIVVINKNVLLTQLVSMWVYMWTWIAYSIYYTALLTSLMFYKVKLMALKR